MVCVKRSTIVLKMSQLVCLGLKNANQNAIPKLHLRGRIPEYEAGNEEEAEVSATHTVPRSVAIYH